MKPANIVLVAVGGSLALSVAVMLDPAVRRDAQVILVFFFTVPIGAVLGVVTGFCVSENQRGDRRAAHQIAVLGGIGGAIVSYMAGVTIAVVYALGVAFLGATWWLGRTK